MKAKNQRINESVNKGKKRVVVGLSGGVDSAVSAALLKEQGYEVTGTFLECWRAPGCRVDEDRKDALEVALKLGIMFEVLDFKKEYRERVVEYFYREYEAGRTPNPDTMCNREIKFGLFYEWVMSKGFDYVATGHYARTDGKKLMRGVDEGKDQSYFLYQLRPEQLEHVLFPVGGMKKGQVRNEARKRGLKVAGKPDSQGICFIGPVDMRGFLEERIKPKKGEVVDKEGGVVGEHDGVWFFTIGQRGGWRVDPGFQKRRRGELEPLYVVEKDVEGNRLVVGVEEELMRDEFEVESLHWVDAAPIDRSIGAGEVFVRIRNLGELVGAVVSRQSSVVRVKTKKPLKGVAAGQACVFYDGDSVDAVVLGGGVIVG